LEIKEDVIKNNTVRVNDITVRIKCHFDSKNDLADSLYSIANLRIKEKVA
jgi:hypothetical protein